MDSIMKKQLVFQGGSFFFVLFFLSLFFLSVSFKKITVILPLTQQLTDSYSTTRQGGGWEGRFRLHK